MRVNPNMLDPFKLYTAPKTRLTSVPASTLAHRILYAYASDKVVELHYLDNMDKHRSLVVTGETSLTQLKIAHGAGFVLVNRNLLVNTVAMSGVFKTGDKTFGCSIHGSGAVLTVSRRSIKAVRAAFASVNATL